MAGQEAPVSAQNSSGQEESRDYSIKVAVDEVQLDAVVLDGNGHQITNLTADDFEIYQDGKRQKTAAAIYIDENRRAAKKGLQNSGSAPFASNPMLEGDKIRQIIIFIVDDLRMKYDSLHLARMSVRKFVETQMQPGDLTAIFRTGGGTSATQMFSSDKRQLLSIIDNMRWGATLFAGQYTERISGVNGVDPFWKQVAYESDLYPQYLQLREIKKMTVLDFQLSIIQYCVRALRDMSGRKSIFFLSPVTTIPEDLGDDSLSKLNSLADDALRSGVVIHTLDLSLEDIIFRKDLPLSKKTGGVILKGPSFWHSDSGIGKANELLKGYYLLSYIPPDNTFSKDDNALDWKSYHQIKIKVKKGTVYNRDGFYGVIDKDKYEESPLPVRAKSLQEVLYSPFQYTDINVNLAAGYAYFPPAGYFLRAWLHIDANDLTFVEEKNGEHSVSVEVATAISNNRDLNHSSKGIKCDIFIKDKDIPLARNKGFDFNINLSFKNHPPLYEQSLPIRMGDIRGSIVPDYLSKKMSAAYYVRTSVRDLRSEKAGSAYRFLEIPDLSDPTSLALSSVFIFNQDEDLAKIKSGDSSEPQSRQFFNPDAVRRSPALRSYLPGESFDYVVMVYNPKPKKSVEPQLESQIVLLKDGQEHFRTEIEDVAIQAASSSVMIPIVKRLTFGKNMSPGNYVMQFMVRDKQPKKNKRGAAQSVDFEIRDASSLASR
jgi:VWFA-related protein